jgi:hypothetical protein
MRVRTPNGGGRDRIDLIAANRKARAQVKELWKVEENRPKIVSGKGVLARLSDWTSESFGTSFGAPAIARQMRKSDIPDEMAQVVGAIEDGSQFPTYEERKGGS